MKLENLVNRYYDLFSENDKYIAQCVVKNQKDCIALSIEEFAVKYHVSKSSLTRFAQKLQMPGYSELRSVLRLGKMEEQRTDFAFKNEVIRNYHKMIEYVRQTDYRSLFHKMYKAERIMIYAGGSSQAGAAKEFQRIFLPLHKKIYYMNGYDMAQAFGSLVQKDDLVILMSLTGNEAHVVELANTLRVRGVHTVSVTRIQMNELASICEENLYIYALSLPRVYQVEYEITTPYFILIELLFIQYQLYLRNEHNFND